MLRELVRERVPRHLPAPIALRGPRSIEPRLGTEPQKILQRHDRKRGDRCAGCAYEGLGHAARPLAEVGLQPALGFTIQTCEPSGARVVVVRAGVDHAVVAMHMRQVRIVGITVEGQIAVRASRAGESVCAALQHRG